MKCIVSFLLMSLMAWNANATVTAVEAFKQLNFQHKKTNNVSSYFMKENSQHLAIAEDIVTDSIAFYQQLFGQSFQISLALPNESGFKAYKAITGDRPPYGMPYVRPNGDDKSHYVVILPATKSGVISQSVIDLKDKASLVTKKSIIDTGHSFEQAATIFPYIIGAHEVSHVYVRNYGIHPINAWTNEFLAQLGAYVYLAERKPKLARLFELTSYQINAEAYQLEDSSLERFERLYSGVGAKDYAWYQGMFLKLAIMAYQEHGTDIFKVLKKQFPAGLVANNADVATRLASERTQFMQIIPNYDDWFKAFKKSSNE
ncbi:MAG: hypothetical protein ACPGR2_06335 [Psychrobium sp.]